MHILSLRNAYFMPTKYKLSRFEINVTQLTKSFFLHSGSLKFRQFNCFGPWNTPIYGTLIQIRTNFPGMSQANAPEIKISKKYWMSFPEICLWHAPENWNFGKISGWVSEGTTWSSFVSWNHMVKIMVFQTPIVNQECILKICPKFQFSGHE